MESVSLPDHRINISLRKLLNEKSPLYRSFRMKVSVSFLSLPLSTYSTQKPMSQMDLPSQLSLSPWGLGL